MAGYIENRMILDDAPDWSVDKNDGVNVKGLGDALWRLSLYYIATGEQWAKDSIVELLKQKRRYWGDKPHPDYVDPIDGFTRDQWQMAMIALFLRNDPEFYDVPVPRFRLSKSTLMTPDLYAWAKYLQTGKRRYARAFNMFSWISLKISQINDAIIYGRIASKTLRFMPEEMINDVEFVWGENWEWFKEEQAKLYPMFARHLRSWRNYTFMKVHGHKIWDSVLDLTLLNVSSKNRVLFILNGYQFFDIKNQEHIPKEGYVWQYRFDTFTANNVHKEDNEDGIHIDKLIFDYLKKQNG